MANKNIRGITVEINGDTTKLDQSLRSMNSTLQETQNDLRAVERALKLDPANIVLLEQKQKLLAAAADESKKKHELLAEALKQAGKDGKTTQEQLDALTRETEEAAVAAKQAQDACDKFSPALSEVAANAQKASDAAGKFAEQTRGISLAGAAVVAGLGAMAVKAASAADEINTLATQTGFSTDFIQQMQYASERVDVSVETMTGAMSRLKRNLDSESSSVTEAFRKIGVNAKELENSGASMDEIFMEVVGALGGVGNELERDQIAMALFGRSADELAGVLDDGGASLMAYGQEAEDLGLILDGEALSGANAFQDAMDRLGAIAEASVVKAGAALLEHLMPAIEWFLGVGEKILEFLARVPAPVLVIVGIIAGLIALISPIATLIRNITGAISGVSTVGKLFAEGAGASVFATFVKWAAVIVGVVAAITALIAVIGALSGKSEDISNTLEGLGDYAGGSVGNITRSSNVRGYATGGVFEPNAPMIIGVGDNRTEREVLAPRSELVSAYGEAMQRYGGSSPNVTIKFEGDLAQLGRFLQPTVTASADRLGKVL